MKDKELFSKKILVVDDDSHILGLITSIFVSLGFNNYDKTTSPEEALAFIQKGSKFDVIFLDINMKEKNGLDLLEEIKQINTENKIIMLSGSATADNVKLALERGANGFVGKPFSPQKILDAIKRVYR